MENASKALLIAGGMLMVMLVIGLVLYVRQNYSDYYASQEEFKNIENVTQFNKQFTSYERNDVKGNELISLINKIIDYNDRMSDKATNNSQGTPIEMEIAMGDSNKIKDLSYDGNTKLFAPNAVYKFSTDNEYTKYDIKTKIIDPIKSVITNVGTEEELNKIAKDIKGIFDIEPTDAEKKKGVTITQKQQEAVKKYNSYIEDSTKYVSDYNTLLSNRDLIYKYYEYVQFKKGIFKCTGVEYDTDSSRVKKIKFEFTGIIQ